MPDQVESLTPEQRAAQLVTVVVYRTPGSARAHVCITGYGDIEDGTIPSRAERMAEDIREVIAAAIRAAVDAEREACAQLARAESDAFAAANLEQAAQGCNVVEGRIRARGTR